MIRVRVRTTGCCLVSGTTLVARRLRNELMSGTVATRRETRVAVAGRVARINVCLTAAERAMVESLARDVGLTVSTYARRVILGQRMPRRDARPIPQINQDTWVLLVEINNSVGRLAEQVESSEVAEEWKASVAEGLGALAEALAPVRRAVLGVEGES